MNRAIPALVAALVLLAPAAALGVLADDGGGDEDTTITVAPTRVGDAYRVDEQLSLPETDGEATRIVTVEAPTTARDRYGVERDTVPFLVQRRVDGEPVRAERCHGAQGHVDTVQRVPLLGDGLRRSVEVAADDQDGGALWTDENPRRTELLTDFDPEPCYGRNPLGGETLEEGDRLPFAFFRPHLADAMDPGEGPVPSAPAEPTTFHGRDALRFTYGDVTYATAPGVNGSAVGVAGSHSFVVADGLPGVVRAEQHLGIDIDLSFEVGCRGCPPATPPTADGGHPRDPSAYGWGFDVEVDFQFNHTTELAGFERGNGTTLEAPVLEPLVPATTPHDGTRGVGHQAAYTNGFDLPYPQEKAWRDVRGDPVTVAYFARHGEAYVTAMTYDRGKRPEQPEQATTDGGWTFLLRDDQRTLRVTTTEVTGAEAAGTTVESPRETAVKDHETWGEGWHVPREDLPAEVPDGDALAQPIQAHGMAPEEVRHVSVEVHHTPDGEPPRIAVRVADVSYADPPEDARGVEMRLQATTGGLTGIVSTEPIQKEEGPWASSYPGDLRERGASTAAFGLPAGPESGAGLAAAGAAGLGLLALLAKFVLLPLYARLRKEDLLDHPVRARLHQRVREEPGLHQAALVDEAGTGKGAALHHLRKLEEADLLARLEQGGYVRYYVPGEVTPGEARRRAVLRAGSNRPVYEVLSEDPSRSLRDVAEEVGVSAPTVHRCLEQLREADLVDDQDRPVAHVDAPQARA